MHAKFVCPLNKILFWGILLVSHFGCEKDELKINDSSPDNTLYNREECQSFEGKYILIHTVHPNSCWLLLPCNIRDSNELKADRIYIPEYLEFDIHNKEVINLNHYSYSWYFIPDGIYSDQYTGVSYQVLNNSFLITNFSSFQDHSFSLNIGTISEIDIN